MGYDTKQRDMMLDYLARMAEAVAADVNKKPSINILANPYRYTDNRQIGYDGAIHYSLRTVRESIIGLDIGNAHIPEKVTLKYLHYNQFTGTYDDFVTFSKLFKHYPLLGQAYELELEGYPEEAYNQSIPITITYASLTTIQ